MRYDEILAKVRERGEYADQDEAAAVTTAVLRVLASRITHSEGRDLAAQLPEPLREAMRTEDNQPTASYGIEHFYERIAEETGARPRTAQWDASAVLTTIAECVSPGELNQLISQLPSGYAVLFGKADLSD